jgi:hypothetical protein
LFSIPVSGQIIHVPGDQPTIQAGINAAVDGDVVLVAEGTYYENINFLGKKITVVSHYYLDGKERHIRKTIIDGSQPANPDFASVVSFMSGEDTNSVLCGFTITGGTGTRLLIPGWPEMRQGGGVICLASGAKVCHNIFKGNVIGGSPFCFGGGMVTGPPGFPVPVVIENNVFKKNEVYGIYSAGGGGLDNYLPGRITNNKFLNNYVHCSMGTASGGGMGVSNLRDPSALPMIVYGNEVTHNKTECTPLDTIGAISAGMQIYGFNITVSNNIIKHNEVICPTDYSYGAGAVLDFPDDRVMLKNNIISNNYFSGGGGCLGGGVAIWDGDAKLYNNVISHNMATYGAGIYVVNDATVSEPEIMNNTLTKNEATVAGGGIYYDRSEVTLMNSIVWGNHAPEGPQISNYMGSIDVSYSDIQGGWTGTGNINQNPKMWPFVYLLRWNSPCIDAGNPDPMFNDPESPWHSGYAMFPSRGFVRNDMGAYGGPAAIDWYSFLGKASFDDEEIAISTPVSSEIKIDNYPNPFNPQTIIQLVIPNDGFVSLKIYNILGQVVATLVSDNLSAGNYDYVWNASNFASGIYIYRLETNGLVINKKMLLLK